MTRISISHMSHVLYYIIHHKHINLLTSNASINWKRVLPYVYLIEVVKTQRKMRNLVYFGFFLCLFLVKGVVSLSQGIDASDPVLRHLFKKIHEQEEKITKLQLKATLDQQYLSSKISTLENKMKTSYSRQKELEKTVQNLIKIIAELEIKTMTTNEKSIYSGRFSEMGTEKSNKPEPDYVIKNTTVGGQGPIALGSRQKRDLRSRSYPGSCCRRASYIVLKMISFGQTPSF